MSLHHYSPEGKKQKDSLFLSACKHFNSANYLEAAKGFKTIFESDPSKKWCLMNYATCVRNAGYVDFSLRIYQWLVEKYPGYGILNEIFNKTVDAYELIKQNKNPTKLLKVPYLKLAQGFPQSPYLVNEDFHNVTLSLCMIVKNEAKNIAQAIQSVLPVIDEVIVVDTGSVDGTIEIVKSVNVKLFQYKWNDDFSEARNFSLKQASCDWILVLDGDETISYQDLFYLKEIVYSNKELWGFTLDQRDYFNDDRMKGLSCQNDPYEESKPYKYYNYQRICRLLKNCDQVYFSYPVYEIAEESIKLNGGEFGYTEIPIHHFGRLGNLKPLQDKRRYYIDILLKHLGGNESSKRKSIYCGNISGAYSFLGDLNKSCEYLQKAIDYNPESAHMHNDMGTNMMRRNNFFEAINWFEKAIALDKRLLDQYLKLAQCYCVIGNVTYGMKMLDKYLVERPDDPRALELLSKIKYLV